MHRLHYYRYAVPLISTAASFLSIAVLGETPPEATVKAAPAVFSGETVAALRQLQEAALHSDYAYGEVTHLTNNIGPRLAGSAQAAEAVQYVASELKMAGCDARLEKTIVPHWVRGEEDGFLVEFAGQATGTTQKIVLTALGGSVATPPNGISAEVICVRNFEELNSLPSERIKGKIVLFNYPFDQQMAAEGRGGEAYGEAVVYRNEGPAEAAKHGAVACLVRSVGGANYRIPHTGQTTYLDNVPKIPAAAVTAEDADLIAALSREGPIKMKLTLMPQTLPDAESANVIGDIRGHEQPDKVIVVSGHLDSWDLGTGAIDDAAGVAVSMEVAHLIQQLQLKPKRTIRIIAWMSEENGSSGSKTYAREHAGEFPSHFAAIETDGGAGHPIGINMTAGRDAKQMLLPVAKILQQSGAGILDFVEHAGADITPLEKAGVPSFAPIQDSRFYFNYHHTAADTLDKIVPRELQENAAVVAVLTYALANMEQPLPR